MGVCGPTIGLRACGGGTYLEGSKTNDFDSRGF